MNSSSQNNGLLLGLLPSGFEDLLPPQAEAEYKAIAVLMGVFAQFGYARVKPPMAEFEDSLLAPGPGAALAADTFRVMDPVTHRMMGLRSDITAQIARIALSRLSAEERPLRLTYANDVIRTRASQARTQRQFMQVGCELIGWDSVEADVEICVVALKGLAALGLSGVTIDFALPKIVGDVFKATKTPEDQIDALRHQLAGPVETALPALEKIKLPKDAKAHVKRLKAVISGVRLALNELGLSGFSLTIDPLETRGFEYHGGVTFTLFSNALRGELGRGGRYDIYEDGAARESAAGFTFYMDTIRQGLKNDETVKTKTVSKAASWREVQELQDAGYITIRAKD